MKMNRDNTQHATRNTQPALRVPRISSQVRHHVRAFTLLEVMLAVGIFFAGVFTVLSLVSASLANARRLQRPLVDAGALAAQLSLTNQLAEGVDSGNLGDVLGDAYKNYTWTSDIYEVQTDKLFQVVFEIQDAYGNHDAVDKISVLFFRPQSPAGSLDGATVIR